MHDNKPTVKIIPAKHDPSLSSPFDSKSQKRVAAYARVSTDSEEQLTSYEAQVGFYTNYIKSNPNWIFVEVYADEAVSGTSTKRRAGFNRMIKDALDGKIDLIITKSISRFARNTVDTLTAVRQLKEKGIEVYFEKENIYTLDSKGELLITIMSSIAQEESRSISENVAWGHRNRMKSGKVTMPYKKFLGYEKGSDGSPQIVESEAATVRRIYGMFLAGSTYRQIAASLTEQGIPTPGGNTTWSTSTIKSILTNEKYAGNAILQKKFTVDFLTKAQKVNEGELPQYFVENSHPAIISPETFDLVQGEVQRRYGIGKRFVNSNALACKVACGDCGGFYGRKVWDSNTKHRRIVWQCNRKYEGDATCKTPHLAEDSIKNAFITAFNRLFADKERYIAEYEEKLAMMPSESHFNEQSARLEIECAEASALARELVRQNAQNAQDQERYKREYDALTARYNAAKSRLSELEQETRDNGIRRENIRRFLRFLKETNQPLTEFDEQIWQLTVEAMKVRSPEDISIMFKSGTEIPAAIDIAGKPSQQERRGSE